MLNIWTAVKHEVWKTLKLNLFFCSKWIKDFVAQKTDEFTCSGLANDTSMFLWISNDPPWIGIDNFLNYILIEN